MGLPYEKLKLNPASIEAVKIDLKVNGEWRTFFLLTNNFPMQPPEKLWSRVIGWLDTLSEVFNAL